MLLFGRGNRHVFVSGLLILVNGGDFDPLTKSLHYVSVCSFSRKTCWKVCFPHDLADFDGFFFFLSIFI